MSGKYRISRAGSLKIKKEKRKKKKEKRKKVLYAT